VIIVANKVASQIFTAGQFGYTSGVNTPPALVPANPAVKFTPLPSFNFTPNQSAAAGGSKAGAVDCVVR
jgi:hypothetical protein